MVVPAIDALATGDVTAETNATVATTATVTTKLSFEVLGKVLDGKSSKQLKQKIKAAINQRMLVPGDDFEPFIRDEYVSTPILASMRACPRTLGVIYVACVPPGKGKSMACYAFLKKYAQGKAIAFSPPAGAQTYVDNILDQLKLDANTGTGLVNALVDELHEGADASKPSYVIFDDFMPKGPNQHDVGLLMQLKSRLRGKNIHCIVLTPNLDSANYSLYMNELASIQPLVDSDAFEEIISTVDVGRITADFTIDWEKHCNMMWDDTVMKRSILLLPDYSKMTDVQKTTVENAIDNYLQEEMTDIDRYYLTIFDVLSEIQAKVNIPPTPANNTATTPRAPDPDRCICCFKSPLAPRGGLFE